MKMRLALLAALTAACNTSSADLLPPPFGPNGQQPTRLFFPTGLAVAPDGTLLVANGNFNHAFDSGTVASIRKSYLDGLFRAARDCDKATPDSGCDQANSDIAFADAVMIGSYAGPLMFNAAGTMALTGSRDSGILNAVTVGAGGVLGCPPRPGNSGKDCRAGLVDLGKAAAIDAPFTIIAGDSQGPGQPAPQPVLFVTSVVPHVDEVSGGVLFTSANVAALDMDNPARLLFTMSVASFPFVANGTAVGPMVFDSSRRQLYLSGCYQRFASGGAGEPGTGICPNQASNLLRIMNVDGQADSRPSLLDMYGDVQSSLTVQLLLADRDANGMPMTLWATMRSPDTLVQIQLPAQPSVAPRVRRAIPLPVSPADMVLIQRPAGGPELIAIAAEKAGAVAIYDTATSSVVSQLNRLGDSPFNLKQIPCPAELPSDSACLATSVFQACRVALIEVPTNAPWNAKLRARMGSCP